MQQDKDAMSLALNNADIDPDAKKFVQALLVGLDSGKQSAYEAVVLPHMNRLIRAIKQMKTMQG